MRVLSYVEPGIFRHLAFMRILPAFLFEGWDSFRVTAGVTCYYDVRASPASNSYPE